MLDGRDLYRHRLAADTIYRATYQRQLSRTLGVEWTPADTYGNRELQGIPQGLVRAAGWGLRFRPSPEAVAWRRGAAGERRTLRTVSFEADQAAQVLPDPGVAVVPIVAVHGAQVPWGKVVVEGVPVVAARRPPSILRALSAVLRPEQVDWLAEQARVRFHAAA
jgi:TrwC relaxase